MMKIYFDMDGVLANFDAVRPNNKDLNHPSGESSGGVGVLFTNVIDKQTD